MAFFLDVRKRLGTVIAIVIGLSLAVFVLETALDSNSNLLRGTSDVVGIIDGNKIHYKEFNEKVDKTIEAYKTNTKQKNIDDNTIFSLREQAWNQLIQEHINEQEFSALGVVVSDEEFKDLFFGADPYPAVKRSFSDPQTGQFDPQQVKYWISNLDKSVQGEDPAAKRAEWINFENGVRDDRQNTKYKALLKGGLYVPKWLAEMDYSEKETKFDIRYVKVPFTLIPDSSVTVSDEEMQSYINKHKEEYKQEESRKVEYVVFAVKPSGDDTAKAKKIIDESYRHIKENPNDTNYIKLNADNSLDKYYYSKENLNSQKAKDSLMEAPFETILSTYFEDGAYKTAKIFDRKAVPDSVKFSLIFITKGADSIKAKIKADSILNAINNGADYVQMAQKFSEDKSSSEKGGDQGYMKQGQAFKNLNDFLFFGGRPGEVKELNTGNGYVIVKITDMPIPVPAIQYAIFTRKVEASSSTDKVVYEQANKFLSANSSVELFTKTFSANDSKLNKQTAEAVKKNDFQLPGLTSGRELVKWAYNANKDDISSIFALDDNYVVAHLVDIKAEGTMQLTKDNKSQFVDLVRKEKKGAMIFAELNSSLALNATLESIASKTGQEVKTTQAVTFGSSYLPNLGNEPKLLGAIANLKPNQSSKAVVGNSGVYVLSVTNSVPAQPIADYAQYKQQLIQSVAPTIEYSLTEALKKTIKIEDDRYKFF